MALVGFTIEGDAIVTSGFDITWTVRGRSSRANQGATVVIDDLATSEPWAPEGWRWSDQPSSTRVTEPPGFRIAPAVITSWG